MSRPGSVPSLRVRSRTTRREWLFDPGSVVRLHRSPDADVALQHDKVSRDGHASLQVVDGTWLLVDEHSRYGIHVNGVRQARVPVVGRVVVRLGAASDGEDLELELVEADSRTGQQPELQFPPAWKPPGGSRADEVTSLARQATDDWSLRVQVDGQPAGTFPPSAPVVVGRGADATLRVDHESVSRAHGRFVPNPGGWSYEDTSTHGSWSRAERISRVEFGDTVELVLGDPSTGPRVRADVVVPPPELRRRAEAARRRRRTRTAVTAGTAAAAVVSLIAVAFAVVAGPNADESETTETVAAEGLEDAKRGTVKLEMADERGRTIGWGSGVIVDPTGLILTNAHVADPPADGQGYLYGEPAPLLPPVSYLRVGIVPSRDDRPVSYVYRAELAVVDGYLDLAVLRITATAEGGALPEDPDFPVVPLGDSTQMRTGQEISLLGFPGVVGSESLTVTEGTVSTFVPDELLDSPRGWIDTDVRGGRGNSGGPVVDDSGEVVGIFAQVRTEGSDTSNRFRPIEQAEPLLEQARSGSPEVVDLGESHLPDVSAVQAQGMGWGTTEDATCANTRTTLLPDDYGAALALFSIADLPPNTALFMALRSRDGYVSATGDPPLYDTFWPPVRRSVTCVYFFAEQLPPGIYVAELWTDPAGPEPLAQLPLAVQ